ncbi:hypothetical protein BA177_00985 [Woeseia oceani]|uniref:Restriction endonuclease type IV Mrr domain-containing protein n=2 Tax=Woeseia oceani TaxID=1548547 RepID=A0A193LBV0_9GAMM|nr:hypothetical protein BA177_00985 [Woeseia oceani]
MQVNTAQPNALLDTAIQLVGERTGLDLTAIEPGPGADLLIRLNKAPTPTAYRVEIKRYLNKQTVALLAARLAEDPTPTMLVTDYVNPQQADRLRRRNIPFIDTAGNTYVNEPPIYVFATGNKPDILPTAKPRVRLFQPTGLKLIFALLNQPGLEQKPYRQQAEVAGIALGGVAWIMGDLRDGGYLIEPTPKTRRLINKRALTDLWVENYPARLREKLILGRYTTTHDRWWQDTDIAAHRAYWGGEIAADRLTHYLKPQDVTLYADKVPATLLLENRLQKVPDGNVEIVKQFWHFDYPEKALQIVPPLLVYADLIATGDARNAELARMVYDEHVARHIRED